MESAKVHNDIEKTLQVHQEHQDLPQVCWQYTEIRLPTTKITFKALCSILKKCESCVAEAVRTPLLC